MAFRRMLKLPVMAMVALSKMVMLPRLLYYFVNLPVIIPRSWFKKLDTILRDLVWDGGRNRVPLQTLRLPLAGGRLGAPEFEPYYLAAQLQWLARWLDGRGLDELPSLTSWTTAILLPRVLDRHQKIKHMGVLLSVAMACWDRCMVRAKDMRLYSPCIPLLGLPQAGGARLSSGFSCRAGRMPEYRQWGTVIETGNCCHLQTSWNTTSCHQDNF